MNPEPHPALAAANRRADHWRAVAAGLQRDVDKLRRRLAERWAVVTPDGRLVSTHQGKAVAEAAWTELAQRGQDVAVVDLASLDARLLDPPPAPPPAPGRPCRTQLRTHALRVLLLLSSAGVSPGDIAEVLRLAAQLAGE